MTKRRKTYLKKKIMKALTKTDFNFPGQKSVYHGKVRDVYNINDEKLVMVATDRISAFDVILPKGIPFKGQVLNQIASKFLDATADICPNWKLSSPDPMVTVGVMCEGFPVEMIVRGYLCGSAWRAYKSGVREICGVKLPEGMRENEKFPTPIITPTTKAEIGEHDADISKEEILSKGLATPEEYALLEKYTLALFQRGTDWRGTGRGAKEHHGSDTGGGSERHPRIAEGGPAPTGSGTLRGAGGNRSTGSIRQLRHQRSQLLLPGFYIIRNGSLFEIPPKIFKCVFFLHHL